MESIIGISFPVKEEPLDISTSDSLECSSSKIENLIGEQFQLDKPEYIELGKSLLIDVTPKVECTVPSNLTEPQHDLQPELANSKNCDTLNDINQQQHIKAASAALLNVGIHSLPENLLNITPTEVLLETLSSEPAYIEENSFTCVVCKAKFENNKELEHHFAQSRVRDKTFRCCNCKKTFRDNTQLKVHYRKHTGEKPFECEICGNKFSVGGNLTKHMRIHTGDRRFECDVCKRKFTQFAHLEDHVQTHRDDEPFTCEKCEMSFKTKTRLRRHIKTHDDSFTNQPTVQCPICPKKLRNIKHLMNHMVVHQKKANDTSLTCQVCGKSFEKKINLHYHFKTHSDHKPFKCSFCDKGFMAASHLRRHLNSHAGLKPHTCEICNRGFPSQQNKKRHMMTHTGERPFTCELCQKSFLTFENMNRHRRTHTGEKPFACDICGRKFAHSTTVKEHRRTHTGDKPYGCSICERRFTLSKMLYAHIKKRHPKHYPEIKKKMKEPGLIRIKLEPMNDVVDGQSSSQLNIPLRNESVKSEDNCEVIQGDGLYDVKIKLEEPSMSSYSETVNSNIQSIKIEKIEIKEEW